MSLRDDGIHQLAQFTRDCTRCGELLAAPGRARYVASGHDDWTFNPPVVDLFDPEWADKEIHPDEFEAAWHRARHVNSEQ